jgi:hypothetical protein
MWRSAHTKLEGEREVLRSARGHTRFQQWSVIQDKTVSSRLLSANREWVYRNNDVIAQEVSKIDFELYQVGLSKGEIVYTEVEEHPLLALLGQVQPDHHQGRRPLQYPVPQEADGRCLLVAASNGSQIEEIFVLQPDKVDTRSRGSQQGRAAGQDIHL